MERCILIPSKLRSFFPRYRCLRRRGARVPEELLEDGLEEEGVVSVRNSISHTVAASIWELSQLTAPRALACSSVKHSTRHRTVSQKVTLSGCLILGWKQLTVYNLIVWRISIVFEKFSRLILQSFQLTHGTLFGSVREFTRIQK